MSFRMRMTAVALAAALAGTAGFVVFDSRDDSYDATGAPLAAVLPHVFNAARYETFDQFVVDPDAVVVGQVVSVSEGYERQISAGRGSEQMMYLDVRVDEVIRHAQAVPVRQGETVRVEVPQPNYTIEELNAFDLGHRSLYVLEQARRSSTRRDVPWEAAAGRDPSAFVPVFTFEEGHEAAPLSDGQLVSFEELLEDVRAAAARTQDQAQPERSILEHLNRQAIDRVEGR